MSFTKWDTTLADQIRYDCLNLYKSWAKKIEYFLFQIHIAMLSFCAKKHKCASSFCFKSVTVLFLPMTL